MATSTSTGAIISQSGYNGGWSSYGSSSQYAGKTSSSYYTYVLKFRTPAFTGVSERLRIVLGAIKGYGSSVTLRYALCSDDSNYSRYVGTYSAVTDPFQIDAGTKSFTGLGASAEYYSIYVDTDVLESNTVYFLYLWPSVSSSGYAEICATSYHMTTLAYNAGLVRIYNGTAFITCIPYVYSGATWKQCLPYVYVGAAWRIGS